jgi:hypothetical protein
MFKSPDFNRAKQRTRDGWESASQKERVDNWLQQRGVRRPDNATDGWELVVGTLCKDLKYDPEETTCPQIGKA